MADCQRCSKTFKCGYSNWRYSLCIDCYHDLRVKYETGTKLPFPLEPWQVEATREWRNG